MIEIERKFLVNSNAFKDSYLKKTHIKQAYLNSDPNRSVRVRIKANKGFLTIKGKGNASGTSRYEWEKEISFKEAEELFLLCEPGAIAKYRYEVNYLGSLYEVDEFLEDNQGLVIAELELNNEEQSFNKPIWLGKEVTGDVKYYNSQLVKNPFAKW